ncbi:Phenol 2-monooxygenase [Verticillium dahliae VDG1]|nr:Phenol 2-monooxygenase [Verticillium dahliae VDG1]
MYTLATADPLPEFPQPPDSPDATALLPLSHAFFALQHLTLPNGIDPPAEPVLYLFLFDCSSFGHKTWRNMHDG